MAVNVTFADFDTVCYNLQYNVMQLIKHCVGISIEINTSENNFQQKLDELDQFDNDIFEILGNIISTMNDQQIINQQILQLLQNHEQRITQLEGG